MDKHTVHAEAQKITGVISGNKPCFVISCNRGEIANDTLRAAKEVMHPPIFTASLYTTGDAQYGYVKQSEFKMCIGPDHFSAQECTQGRAMTPYMDIPILFTAANNIRREAERLFGKDGFQIGVHPGYGMLSEEPEFVKACNDEGFIFIGPGYETQVAMGPKDEARRLAIQAGLPVVPGTGDIKTLRDAKRAYKKLIKENPHLDGRRFRLKAVAGGGGRGQIIFDSIDDLPEKFKTVQTVVANLGWDSHFVMELNIEVSRHYEIQMFCDLTFFGRECTLMRSSQKEIEEFLSPEVLKEKGDMQAAKELQKVLDSASKLAKCCKLDSVATLECIYDETAQKIYFLEMNTRIQVEHPVSNAATGVDLLRDQIKYAFGAPIILEQKDIKAMGHSIEARITNLDPYSENYAPMGMKKIDTYIPPERTDRIRHYGYANSGNTITSFDPMFAKIVGRGATRMEAIEALFRGLSEFIVDGKEFRHNIAHQLFVISHPKFVEHNYNSQTMDEIRELFLTKFVPFLDENYGKENRYNSPIVAEAVNHFYGHDWH